VCDRSLKATCTHVFFKEGPTQTSEESTAVSSTLHTSNIFCVISSRNACTRAIWKH